MMSSVFTYFALMVRMLIFCTVFIGPPASFALLNSAYLPKISAAGLVIFVSLQRAA